MKQTMNEKGKCPKCGSKIALVDETITHLMVSGEIVKTYSGDFNNQTCVRCCHPKLYADFAGYESDGATVDNDQRNAGAETPSSTRKESSQLTKTKRRSK